MPDRYDGLSWCRDYRSVGLNMETIHPLLNLLGQVQDAISGAAADAGRKSAALPLPHSLHLPAMVTCHTRPNQ